MIEWKNIDKNIKSISPERKKAIDILAYLEVDYDEEKVDEITEILKQE